MTRLSVNINKVALLRNSRGANFPDLIKTAIDCEEFGAQGITVHPRPDQRHVKYTDIPALKEVVTTEFNIEGYPSEAFIDLVIQNKPDQCTLVPDLPGALTSDNGWDTIAHQKFLKTTVSRLQDAGIRVSLFIDPIEDRLYAAKETGTDRIEFYTGPYAHLYTQEKAQAISAFMAAAYVCNDIGLGINAGHDLNLDNLKFFKSHIPQLLEVSIGHALIVDALYLGLKNTIQLYLKALS
ncbi:MAG: pyridoxine 5'-phosphate synthase [Saprospiraceae bacterium]|nr:MAG: pyridoxine 5'-phosphate synthase [Bacteroidetes bacterium OLB9]MCO6463700.1 pyridoxine 5'-phosphate synthase [Saprospiraceae bacterium]